MSGNSVIHHHAIIRKCLDYAYKMDIIPNNPADKVQRPKKEQYIGSFYNENKAITIKHTVIIAKLDGKRLLTKKDRTKNKSSYRILPLVDEMAEKLLEFKEQQ